MATLLNSANFNGKNGTHFKLRLEYTYTQSQANNQTTIVYTLKMVSSDGWSAGGSANSITGYIGGTSSSDIVGRASGIGVNSTITLGSRTYTITHNADGTFPNTSYFARIDTAYSSVNRAEVSGNLTGLPTIPRASSPTLSNTNFNIGSSITLTTNRKSNSFTHTIVLAFGTYSKTYTNVADSQVINTNDFASNMYAQIPNAKSGTGTITTTTYNGSTQIGSPTQLTFTANVVESNANPQVTALTYTVDSTTSSLANSTSFINGVTNATIKITANRRLSSTLTKVFLWYYSGSNRVILSSQDVSTDGTYTFTINNISVSKVYGGATDSRGYTTYNTSINNVPTTFVNYVSLTADTSANIKRTNQTEAIVKINSFKGNYFNASFGSQSNTLTIKWKYKETTASTYSQEYTIPASSITMSGNTYTISNYTLTNGTTTELFNYQKAYNIQVIVQDKIYTRTATYTITSGMPNFAIFPNVIVSNEEIVTNSVRTKNILDIHTFVKGRLFNGVIEKATGTTNLTLNDTSIEFTVSEAWNSGTTSGFIPVEQGNYTFSATSDKKVYYYIDTYDSSRSWIERLLNANGTGAFTRTFSIGSGVAFIRLHFEVASVDTFTITEPQIEKGLVGTTFSKYQNLDYYPNVYSESEIIIGSWVDGKPLYRKCYKVSSLPNNTTTQIIRLSDIPDRDFVRINYGYSYATWGAPRTYPIIRTTGLEIYVSSSKNVDCATSGSTDWSIWSAFVVVEYTKTTD